MRKILLFCLDSSGMAETAVHDQFNLVIDENFVLRTSPDIIRTLPHKPTAMGALNVLAATPSEMLPIALSPLFNRLVVPITRPRNLSGIISSSKELFIVRMTVFARPANANTMSTG